MYRKLLLVTVVMLVTLVSKAHAEKANMSPEQLRKTATHVITGEVVSIFERTEAKGDWRYKFYVAEVRVSGCEKGEGLEKENLVYVRYWKRGWIGRGRVPPSTSGHRGLPSEGESLRIYLAKNAYDGFDPKNNDGGYNVIGANGFEKLTPPEKK